MTHLACPLLLLCLNLPAFPGQPAYAGTAEAEAEASKFSVLGETLLYDTENAGAEAEITTEDADTMRDLLRANPGITTLRLNSGGGSVWAAREMARIILDFELDTDVDGECSSSCVRVFLAGQKRTMQRGSKIGFHSREWTPDAVESYYNNLREDKGWDTPFEFASWIYRDTYAEAYEDMTYAMSRGVAAAFAVEMHAPRDTMWFPDRTELHGAGLLRD